MDLERDAGLREMSPESGTGPVVPGSHCIQEGQVVLRVAWPGLGIQRAAEQGRDHSPLCTGVHASAVSGPTLPAQSARPGSPSEGRGSVSPRIRAAGAERPPYWCASAGCAGQPLGSSASSSAVSETPQGLSQSAARYSHRVAWLRQGEKRFSLVLDVPSAAVPSQ